VKKGEDGAKSLTRIYVSGMQLGGAGSRNRKKDGSYAPGLMTKRKNGRGREWFKESHHRDCRYARVRTQGKTQKKKKINFSQRGGTKREVFGCKKEKGEVSWDQGMMESVQLSPNAGG